jgi:hypothetical protein
MRGRDGRHPVHDHIRFKVFDRRCSGGLLK